MSIPLFVNDKYSCNGKIFYQKVNCEHWNLSDDGCNIGCSLKNISPTSLDCHKCQERQPLSEEKQRVAPKITPITIHNYTKAEFSQVMGGKVSPEIFEHRKEICMGCDRRDNHDPANESIGWCGACGCGSASRAALSKKLQMPKTKCPLNKFGEAQGTGFNVVDAMDSAKGITKSVIDLIDPKP